ncbi:MAG: transporter substrate-binding domain-containing protein [Duncaniella sp.]|nr:transporter substrate-binding domain-containing protein [Duncaniella sp.]
MNTKFQIFIAALMACMAVSCSCSSRSEAVAEEETKGYPDTLRVATLYSPGSYFIYRETRMGYDYDLVNSLVKDKGIALSLQVAPGLGTAIEWLDSGKVDLIAYEVPVTAEYKSHVLHCGPKNVTTQVLVQPKVKKDADRIADVTGLIGRDVYVEAGSKYEARLNNLNDELGGGINIHSIDRDTLITDDLIAMVGRGDIPLTIVDSDIAHINKTYFNSLDITLEVSFPQRSQWAVSPSRPWLADSINAWIKQDNSRRDLARIHKRYFELSKNEQYEMQQTIDLSRGFISPFDNLFRKYAHEIGWDWRLLAAQGYVESHFDPTLVSWAGARGVMQVMPSTARAYHHEPDELIDNDVSISTAAEIIKDLDKAFINRVPDPQERLKFVVGAYNSGLAHIFDAIALAGKYGYDPQVWDGNVARAVLMKSHPEYYNDPVCKYGYFRGHQTFEYVNRVFDFYTEACHKISA